MVNFDATTLTAWLVGFFVLAAVGAVTGLATMAALAVSNRRVRVARHEGLRTYYGRLVLSH